MSRAAVLHRGPLRGLFGDFPEQLAADLDLPILDEDRDVDLGLILAWDGPPPRCRTFVPFDAIVAAQDKREQFRRFRAAGVSIPETRLFDDFEIARAFALLDPDRRWLLKWPVGSGSVGHTLIDRDSRVTPLWNPPFLIQEFVALERPEIHRVMGCDGELFGFTVRSFPPGTPSSPLVSTHRGAIFGLAGSIPPEVARQARLALSAFGLFSTFGCVDLIVPPGAPVLVLEVNADGLSQFVDRMPGLPGLCRETGERLRAAIHRSLVSQ
jgi:glutathione synthase/RimK-type ligase-like ATP-grasp enzyme